MPVDITRLGAGNPGDDHTEIFASLMGRSIYLPAGRYNIRGGALSTIRPTHIVGDGKAASIINVTTPGGDGLVFNSLGNGEAASAIRDVGFASSVPRTSGAYIAFVGEGASYSVAENLRLIGGHDGVRIDTHAVTLDKVEGLGIGHHGVSYRSGVLHKVAHSVFAGWPGAFAVAGISVMATGDLTLTDVQVIQAVAGLELAPGAGQAVCSVNAVTLYCDGCVNGLVMRPHDGGAVLRSSFIDPWFGGAIQRGALMDGAGGLIDGIEFAGPTIRYCGIDGMRCQNGVGYIAIRGGSASGCGAAGLSLGGGMTRGFLVDGLRAGPLDGTNAYGMWVEDGADNYQIVNVNLLGNTVANLVNASSGASKCRVSGLY